MTLRLGPAHSSELSIPQKLLRINWALALLIALVAGVGLAMQYSVADANFEPWAKAQALRFAVCFLGMFTVAMIDIRVWRQASYWIYALALILLIGVEMVGSVGMGAQRWIELGPLRLQPSELMKVALVLALARFYHDIAPMRRAKAIMLIPPLLMIALPAMLVVKQPDLGTAVLIGFSGIATMFLAGVSFWFFGLLICGIGGTVYAVLISQGTSWQMLKNYQYDRIAVFLNPAMDPQGAGYHISQSKIAFGSGGAYGAGYLQGPQSRLDFLPEKHTDFIMTVLGEEFGLVGALVLLGLYLLILAVALIGSIRVRHLFGKLVCGGVAATFFAYFAINMAMIMGLAPVVGVPLPLVSYGGTSMLVLLFAFGLLMSAQVHSEVKIRGGGG